LKDAAVVKTAAIAGLVILETINMLTMRIDGVILLSIGLLIGGLAGYEFGKRKE